jgi:hypothetical protein
MDVAGGIEMTTKLTLALAAVAGLSLGGCALDNEYAASDYGYGYAPDYGYTGVVGQLTVIERNNYYVTPGYVNRGPGYWDHDRYDAWRRADARRDAETAYRLRTEEARNRELQSQNIRELQSQNIREREAYQRLQVQRQAEARQQQQQAAAERVRAQQLNQQRAVELRQQQQNQQRAAELQREQQLRQAEQHR